MPRTKDEWNALIDGHKVSALCAGTKIRIPMIGETVRVLSGERVGSEFKVVAIRGNVYGTDQRIFVDHEGDQPIWYFPWDLHVVDPQILSLCLG